MTQDYGYDYILPKGCRQLGFPPQTAIEVKKNLVPGLQSILISDVKRAYETRKFEKFLILYEEGHVNKEWIPHEIKDFVMFLSREELQAKTAATGILPKPKKWEDENHKSVGEY